MIIWNTQFVNEENTDTLIVSKFKLLTDDIISDIMESVENSRRVYIYCTVSQETSATLPLRLKMLDKLRALTPSKIVIVKPFQNDLTVMGSKKYVSYIPDILYRISLKYPSSNIKNIKTELPASTVSAMVQDEIEAFKDKRKKTGVFRNLTYLPNIRGISDETITQMLYNKEMFSDKITMLNLDEFYDELKSYYTGVNESLTFKDLNIQYKRDDFVIFSLMRDTSKLLYKSIYIISANFDYNENDEDDYSLVDVSFDVPKDNPFCRVSITNLLSVPNVQVTPLREITLDDSHIASDLNKFIKIISDYIE